LPTRDKTEDEFKEAKTQKCSKCGIIKNVNEFHKDKHTVNGVTTQCKECRNEHYHIHKKRISEHRKKYREKNKGKIAKQQKSYRESNKEKIAKRSKKYREANKEKIAEMGKRYREENREKEATRKKRWREANKERVSETGKSYYKKNKEKILERQKEHYPLIKRKKSKESKQRYQAKRQIISKHKNLCVLCGDTREHVLVFHHKNPKKKEFSIAGHNRSKENLLAEIKKCIVLCNNCHHEFHYFDRNPKHIPKELLEKYKILGIWLEVRENNERAN